MSKEKIKSPAVLSVLSSFREKLDADENIDSMTVKTLFEEISNDSAITAAKLEEAIFSQFNMEDEEE